MVRFLARCQKYGRTAHTGVPNNSKFGNIEELRGKMFFEILHSRCCIGLWVKNECRVNVQPSHRVYALLERYHGLKKK